MAEPITNVLGVVSIKNRGVYDSETSYEKLNVVTYQGSSYCAKGPTQGNLPTNTDYWDLIAEKGEKGDTGEAGHTPVKGTDYYTAEDKAELESTLSDDVTSEVTEQLGDLTSATPLVASSTAGMSDTTRIYVNSTDGHWYWYDGDSWEDGGVYQATGIADGSVEESSFSDNLKAQFFNANSSRYANKVVDRIENLEEVVGNELIYASIDFYIGGWILNGRSIDTTKLKWLSCNPIELKAGNKFILPANKYVAQLVKFKSAKGYQVESKSSDIRSNIITIETDGVYALTMYILSAPQITNEDLEYAEENIKISAFSNTIDTLRNNVDTLKNKLKYTSHYDNLSIAKGKWGTNPTPDAATIWCASERMFLRKGDVINYNKYLYQTLLVEFNDATSAPSKINETSSSGIYNIEVDGYYALNIFKDNTLNYHTNDEWTDDEVAELIQNVSVNSITLDEIEDLKHKEDTVTVDIDVDYLAGSVSSGNLNYFHTTTFGSSSPITINYLNSETELSSLYPDIKAIDNDGNTTVITDGLILPAGNYYLQGYRLPIQHVTDEILAQVKADFKISTLEKIADYIIPSNTLESQMARLKPYAEDDIQKVKEDYIQEFKYPTIPVWGHEYLQHWYKKVYEARENATVVLDGDSITAGYEPKYSDDPDTFVNMRGYAIKKIMKAGNYPLSQLTVVNNGHGGRKTGEWVGNPTYGSPTYIAQYPNGFLHEAMQNNPDLLIIAWGMNDADKTNSELSGLTLEERLEVFKNNMIEGLKRIRGNEAVNGRPAYNKSMNDLSIIICMPTVGGNIASGRGNYLWNQYVREIIRPLCRKYGCAFADMTMRTYAHNDMSPRIWSSFNAAGTGYDNIHPNMYSSAQTMSMLQDLIYPVCMWNLGQIN